MDGDSFDILVAGGGAAGLACALLLAGKGWSVAVVGPRGTRADGRTVATAGTDGDVHLWDVESHTRLASPVTNGAAMTAVAFSPDGRTLAFAGEDRLIRLWDVRAQRLRGPPLQGHTDRVIAVAFSADGTKLASAGDDRTVRVWTLGQEGAAALVLRGHTRQVLSVAFSPDGRTLASSAVAMNGNDYACGTRFTLKCNAYSGSVAVWNP